MREIEEMALIICEYVKSKKMKKVYIIDYRNKGFLLISHNTGLAKAFYEAGYRKVKPVIIKINDKVEVNCDTMEDCEEFFKEIAKYIVKGENEDERD